MESLPSDHFVKAHQFTPKVYRDVYPAIEPTQASLSQKGKVVIVTGASRGIGARGFVPAFAAAGAKAIVLVAQNADKLNAVASGISKYHPNVETLAVPTNIADPASVKTLFEKVKDKYGHADVLVNNAAVFNHSAIAPIKAVDQQSWWDEQTINVRGTFLITQSFLASLPTPETPAKIVTLTTGASYEIFPALSTYGLSKLAVFQLMTYVAAENPNVVAVALDPGVVETDMLADAFRPFALDTPELVGGTGVWLASWENSREFLSGRYVSVNWDVEGVVERKEEILEKNLLIMGIHAELGAAQFQK